MQHPAGANLTGLLQASKHLFLYLGGKTPQPKWIYLELQVGQWFCCSKSVLELLGGLLACNCGMVTVYGTSPSATSIKHWLECKFWQPQITSDTWIPVWNSAPMFETIASEGLDLLTVYFVPWLDTFISEYLIITNTPWSSSCQFPAPGFS